MDTAQFEESIHQAKRTFPRKKSPVCRDVLALEAHHAHSLAESNLGEVWS